ncbi:MAG: 2-oxo acid dehydrogenase subunit E2 [Clostridia bacterium]|nr:2-oxo acid dehydrogenase subunit E2 [Clostridia bacterium]
MATPVMMPNVGITVETCVLTKWLKQKGETVQEGEVLFTYETDKSTLEQEAPVSGTVLEIFFGEDSDVPVMTNVCVIGNPGENFEEFRPGAAGKEDETPAAPVKEEAAPAQAVQSAPAAAPVLNTGFIKASPRAKTLAGKRGVNLQYISGTGPDGRIIERDVFAAAQGSGLSCREKEQAAPGADYVDEKMSVIRRTIAKQMSASLQTAAQLTHTLSFDASDILAFRKGIKSGEIQGYGNITLNDMILFVVSRTLAKPEHRALNAHLLENDIMRYFSGVHMGVAVDTDRGLMVPTLFDCDKKPLNRISEEAKALAAKCRNGSALPDDLKGGTFTVSNLGAYGIEHFTPVINVPQTAILGVNTISTRIKAVDGGFKTYQAMGLSLTYDHRAVDGGPASRFLSELKTSLENFTSFLKEQEG